MKPKSLSERLLRLNNGSCRTKSYIRRKYILCIGDLQKEMITGSLKNLANGKTPHIVINMCNGKRVSIVYFHKRQEWQVFDNYGVAKCIQNIWIFKAHQHVIRFLLSGLDDYSKVLNHRTRVT